MKKRCRPLIGLLITTLLLTALSGCGKVDGGLLRKTAGAIDALAELESGGYRREGYLTDAQTLTQSAENWFCPAGGEVDWCSLTEVYKDDGTLQMESGVVRRGGVMYQRFSIDGAEADWRESESPAPPTEMRFPKLELLTEAENYEFFRKEKDGSITFSYSPAGLEAFHVQLVELVKEQIPTEFDEQYTEEQRVELEKQYAYMAATAEQTKVTAFSGVIILDETGSIRSHEIRYSVEGPELESDGKGDWATTGTKTMNMRFVTEVLAYTGAEAEQRLAELFAQLP